MISKCSGRKRLAVLTAALALVAAVNGPAVADTPAPADLQASNETWVQAGNCLGEGCSLYMEIYNSTKYNGSVVDQWTWNGSATQYWYYWYLSGPVVMGNKHTYSSSGVQVIEDHGWKSDVPLDTWAWVGQTNEEWYFNLVDAGVGYTNILSNVHNYNMIINANLKGNQLYLWDSQPSGWWPYLVTPGYIAG